MSKFKKGDNVKIVADLTPQQNGAHLIGRSGKIVSVRAKGAAPFYSSNYKYVVESDGVRLLANAEELELTTVFEAGNYVEVIKDDHPDRHHNIVGHYGVVKEVTNHATYNVVVTLDDGRELRGAVYELRLLAATKPEPKLIPSTEEPSILPELKLQDTTAEAVEHPAHYGGDTPYEVIKVAEAWGFNDNAYLFNALKYLARADKKGNKVEDLRKLMFYVQREITLEEAK